MALIFFTDKAKALLSAFEERIAQEDPKAKIRTWKKTKKGNFTHVSEQWGKKAFFKPKTLDDRLIFNIIPLARSEVSVEQYAFYHGHLTETFIVHFSGKFVKAVSTAKPTKNDKMKSS